MKLYKNKHFQGFKKKITRQMGFQILYRHRNRLWKRKEVGPQSGAAAATLDFRARGSGSLAPGGALLPQWPLSSSHHSHPCLPPPITSPPWTGNTLSPGHLRITHHCKDRLNTEVYDRRPISLLDPTFCGGGSPFSILHIHQELERRVSDKHMLSKLVKSKYIDKTF